MKDIVNLLDLKSQLDENTLNTFETLLILSLGISFLKLISISLDNLK